MFYLDYIIIITEVLHKIQARMTFVTVRGGIRVKKEEDTAGSNVVLYSMYAGNNPVIEEKYDGATLIETRFNIISGSSVLGHIRKVYGAGEDYEYFFNDNLGSRRVVLDSSGAVTDRFTYSAYGEVTHVSGTNGELASFTGKGYDGTGLLYFNARYYDPEVGRFITEDPSKDGISWYGYVNNNPINFIDQTGRYLMENTTNNLMQNKEWYGNKIGESSTIIGEEGCTVTALSNSVSDITGDKITPDIIAADKNLFSGDLAKIDNVASKYGLNYEFTETDMIEKLESWGKDLLEDYSAFAKVEIGKYSHWVGVDGVKTIGGSKYVRVNPTSINDLPGINGFNSLRKSWKIGPNGEIYIPAGDVRKVGSFSDPRSMKEKFLDRYLEKKREENAKNSNKNNNEEDYDDYR